MFGLKPQGFIKKKYADIIDSMETRAKTLYDENVNLSNRSPLGIFLKVVAWFIGQTWEVSEDVYNSAFLNTAEESALDKIGMLIGITRNQATKSTGEVTFIGDDGTVIPSGFIVSTEDGIEFETTEEVEISGGTATASIIALESGLESNVAASSIIESLELIVGLDSLTNAEATTGGQNQETDAEFRERYKRSTALPGAATVDSIIAALLQVEDVRSAVVIENDTNSTVDGIPAKSFESFVLGGESEDIAKAIFDKKPAGIQAFGDETEIVTDIAGQTHSIGFTYVQVVDVYVDIVSIETNGDFPLDGNEQIKTSIIRYIGGTDEDGQLYAGISIGQDVIYNKIINAIYTVSGVQDIDVDISSDNITFNKNNIVIGNVEIAETDHTKITIDGGGS